MKYAEELYTGSGFYGQDREGELKNYKEKVVKCRKPHECMGCDRGIKAGEYAVYESGFLDGKPVTCYTCLECIENWLEESGQVDRKSVV